MKLKTKFNLVLVGVFSVSLLVTGFLSHKILQQNAREEVIQQAGMMMEAALAIRGYTIGEIKPLLGMQLKRAFLPQSVPAYAATQAFHELRKKHPEYTYKEATLNPTNPRNRAVDWEADVVEEFRNNSRWGELIGERETPTGRSLYLARPIQINDRACLTCHSTVEAAPKTLLALYGPANGFGWKLNEVVGAQIVSVPTSVPFQKANSTFFTFMGMLVGIFTIVAIMLNVMLGNIVVKPVTNMSRIADQVSMGKLDAPEFEEGGKDEIASLAVSFNRMRRSLEKAMKMLEE